MNSTTTEITELQNKIHDLQSRSAFQEDSVNQLNAVIIEQQQMIDKLNSLVEAMRGAIQSIQPEQNSTTTSKEELPPHY